jgi:hypothetical protein
MRNHGSWRHGWSRGGLWAFVREEA